MFLCVRRKFDKRSPAALFLFLFWAGGADAESLILDCESHGNPEVYKDDKIKDEGQTHHIEIKDNYVLVIENGSDSLTYKNEDKSDNVTRTTKFVKVDEVSIEFGTFSQQLVVMESGRWVTKPDIHGGSGSKTKIDRRTGEYRWLTGQEFGKMTTLQIGHCKKGQPVKTEF